MVDIRTFGGFHLRQNGLYYSPNIISCSSKILVYLLINNNIPQRREKLADIFFAGLDIGHALNALSTSVWRIKRWMKEHLADGSMALEANRHNIIMIGSDTTFLDISRFEAILGQCASPREDVLTAGQRTAMESALAEYQGPFMDGESDDWILYERERLHCLYIRGLNKMMSSFAAERNYEEALDCGRRILQVDPFREYVHREMIRCYAASGQRALALRQFQTCREMLLNECSIEPLSETVNLTKAIRNGSAVPVK